MPYFLQEQNTVAGLVNRVFARGARRAFLGMPLAGKGNLACACEVTGTPVRTRAASYEGFNYPVGFSKEKTTVLICGGSQGAKSMNESLVPVVQKWGESGMQVVWQTGTAFHDAAVAAMRGCASAFVFDTISDLYPYYAAAALAVARAGASTLAEASCFGLPVVLVPLPWAAENHQWMNAGFAQEQGWGIRIAQDAATGANVGSAVERIVSNKNVAAAMRSKALENSPAHAAEKIVDFIATELGL